MSTSLTLYELDERYLALLDTEDLVGPDQEQAFKEDLEDALLARDEKFDRITHFLLFLGEQQDHAEREIRRLKKRKDVFANVESRLKQMITWIMKHRVGQDVNGKYKNLRSRNATLFLRALPSSVDITNDTLVPDDYKIATVQMPLTIWRKLCDAHPELRMRDTLNIEVKHVHVDKDKVKAAIEAGTTVPGADLRLSGHEHTLILK